MWQKEIWILKNYRVKIKSVELFLSPTFVLSHRVKHGGKTHQ